MLPVLAVRSSPPPSLADVYELLKELLSSDDAVTGEAAGLAMGLVMIGTRSPSAIEDMSNVRSLGQCQCWG